MDQRQLSNVISVLRFLGPALAAEKSAYAHVPPQLALVLAAPTPLTGCRGCGGRVEPVRNGRPRLYCETCHKPRTKSTVVPAPHHDQENS